MTMRGLKQRFHEPSVAPVQPSQWCCSLVTKQDELCLCVKQTNSLHIYSFQYFSWQPCHLVRSFRSWLTSVLVHVKLWKLLKTTAKHQTYPWNKSFYKQPHRTATIHSSLINKYIDILISGLMCEEVQHYIMALDLISSGSLTQVEVGLNRCVPSFTSAPQLVWMQVADRRKESRRTLLVSIGFSDPWCWIAANADSRLLSEADVFPIKFCSKVNDCLVLKCKLIMLIVCQWPVLGLAGTKWIN